MTEISSAPTGAGALPISSGWQNNSVNQSTRNTLADASYWVYTYDDLGQVQ